MSIVFQGTIKNPPGAGKGGCLAPYLNLRKGLYELIDAYQPSRAYIEQMFAGANPTVAEMLFYAAFTCRLALHDLDIPFTVLPVNGVDRGWRWFVLGSEYSTFKGAAAKRANKEALSSALGVKLANEHQADAVGIAVAGYWFEFGIDFRDVLETPKPILYREKPDAKTPKPASPRRRAERRSAA